MGVGRSSRSKIGGAAVFIAVALSFALACATGLRSVDGGFEDPELGVRVEAPTGAVEWRRVKVKDVDLRFSEDSSDATMSLFSDCGRTARQLADAPEILARQLLFGLRTAALPTIEEIEVAGHPAIAQVFEAEEESRRIMVKTVSVALQGCSYDFVLVAPRAFAAREVEFDRWWSSFSAIAPSAGGGA